ncbi:TRAP transporter substrate-binding protein [Alsobacter sp. KACC 23698]|uniref:TRAP transporter substrate-binding protein n=1 Tax=Alsobacter sp. KACC 23698 TaxID=3149229 RepID=A0AAU7JEZ2_9HYPH
MSMSSFIRPAVLAASMLAGVVAAQAQSPTTMRVAGNFSSSVTHSEGIERPFFAGLAKETGLPITMNFNPMDVVNVKADDALRLLRSGAFDVMSVQIGQASRDDPFFEGIDLAGVSTNFPDLQKAIDAYRGVFDERLQKKFNAKVLTLWPFGPQVFYCRKPVASVADFNGLKVRSFTPTMSALLQKLGATPVTLSFSEVYTSLGSGVVDCGVTSPNSGNTGKWPEVTTHYIPLAVSGSVQGHFINLAYWNKFSPAEQAKIEAAFKTLEKQMWDYAVSGTEDSQSCNTGGPCKSGQPFKMTLVTPSADDVAKIAAASAASALPLWRDACNKVDPQCSATWNKTVGAARGLKID